MKPGRNHPVSFCDLIELWPRNGPSVGEGTFEANGVGREANSHDGEVLPVESEGPITISELLEKLGIPASTVLAVHGDTIVPHTSRIESDISLELIVVSSGG